MQNNLKKLSDGRILLVVSRDVYARETILNTSYKFIDRVVISINDIGEGNWGIYFSKKTDGNDAWEETINSFSNKLIEQQVREDTKSKYANVRDVIVKHAFSPVEDLNKELRVTE